MSATIIEPKPGVNMGRVLVPVSVRNAEDCWRVERGELKSESIRQISVETLVDTGATFLCLPEPLIEELGLRFDRMREARTVSGPMMMKIFAGALLEVHGRACNVEVMALPESRQPLLGQIPLETLDYWVDVTNHRLVGNHEHDGQWMAEIY